MPFPTDEEVREALHRSDAAPAPGEPTAELKSALNELRLAIESGESEQIWYSFGYLEAVALRERRQ